MDIVLLILFCFNSLKVRNTSIWAHPSHDHFGLTQSHKMVKHTQTIGRQIADELLNVFEHFVKLALKGLITKQHLVTVIFN